jgi:hypothetical protein
VNEETAGGKRSNDTAVRTVGRRFYADKLKGLDRHFYTDGGSSNCLLVKVSENTSDTTQKLSSNRPGLEFEAPKLPNCRAAVAASATYGQRPRLPLRSVRALERTHARNTLFCEGQGAGAQLHSLRIFFAAVEQLRLRACGTLSKRTRVKGRATRAVWRSLPAGPTVFHQLGAGPAAQSRRVRRRPPLP